MTERNDKQQWATKKEFDGLQNLVDQLAGQIAREFGVVQSKIHALEERLIQQEKNGACQDQDLGGIHDELKKLAALHEK